MSALLMVQLAMARSSTAASAPATRVAWSWVPLRTSRPSSGGPSGLRAVSPAKSQSPSGTGATVEITVSHARFSALAWPAAAVAPTMARNNSAERNRTTATARKRWSPISPPMATEARSAEGTNSAR